MEQERYYLRVGLFVTAMVVLGFIVIGWFAPNRHNEVYVSYAIYFAGSVDGVSLGSPVRLKGITVGQVARIDFDKNDNNRIFVRVDLLAHAPIRNDTVASVQALGITGTSFISLDSNGSDPTPKTAKPGEPYPVIASRPSSLEKVFASVPELIDEVKKLSQRGEALLSDDNIKAVNHALESMDHALESIDASAKSLETLTGGDGTRSVASVMQSFNEALVESKLALREVRMLARTLRDDPSLLISGTAHEGKKVP
jgi:phospholipid/cholesterol/gamma-HCH transport system substrate-binding protein